jgi:RNA polymerase sigma-70 factor (ECF subfamily)
MILREDIGSLAPKGEHHEPWLIRVQQGDQEAASALVERLYPTVARVARSHRSRRASAEDLTQTIFMKVFTKLGQFSGRAPLEHWVARVATNTCLNELRFERDHPEFRMADVTEKEEAVLLQLLATPVDLPVDCAQESRELLEKLFDGLKADERLVVRLLHIEERSVKEISRSTGWSESLVKVKAFRARSKLRRRWQRLNRSTREAGGPNAS